MKRYGLFAFMATWLIIAAWCSPVKAGLLDSIWEVNVPPDIAVALKLDKNKVKLNQAQGVYDRYVIYSQTNLDNFEMNIVAANNSYAGIGKLINTLTDIGVSEYFPYGGFALIAAAYIAPPPKVFRKKEAPPPATAKKK